MLITSVSITSWYILFKLILLSIVKVHKIVEKYYLVPKNLFLLWLQAEQGLVK